MEDQGAQSPNIRLVNDFPFFDCLKITVIDVLLSKFQIQFMDFKQLLRLRNGVTKTWVVGQR